MQQLRSCNRQLQIDIDCLTKEIDLFQARGMVCLRTSATLNIDGLQFPLSACIKSICILNRGHTRDLQNHHVSLAENKLIT